ncbi:TPA: toll/interleukin-1 receptor domain-containing protein, partial [Kluyvera ascorbata]|nr:toll/interleukin-1 receptor domain-containing protein [Kluyvera ascorbata]
MENRNIFISYSWDNQEHKEWVLNLANQLSEYEEIHVTLDQYDLDTSIDKNYFMEKGAFDSDIILIIITPDYAKKSNTRSGGVGIEATLLSSRYWDEILVNQKTSIIPILRSGEFSSSPRYLRNHFSLDFRDDLNFDTNFNNL